MTGNPALAALAASGIPHRVVRHPPAGSLAEAAALRGITPGDIVKTMVLRRGKDNHLLALVPGDRVISWPKLRALLGVSRISMPDSATALKVTGFPRGTITPFGTLSALPVIADKRVRGKPVSIGAGEPGATVLLDGDDLLTHLEATVADISDPGR